MSTAAGNRPYAQTMSDSVAYSPIIRRLRYAWIAGAAIWLTWLISLALGPGHMDLAGQVLGTDYLQFYTAGVTLQTGQGAHLYDADFQMQLERKIIGPHLQDYFAFITPPFLAWLYQPLAALPYELSFAVWSLFGLAALWASLRLLGQHKPITSMVWSLSFFPVFASISFGQNSLLSLAILSLTYRLWRSRRPVVAGLIASLLLYKPQLLLGVGLLWLLEWRRDRGALLGLLMGGSALAVLSAWRLPAATQAYVNFASNVLPNLPAWQRFPLWNLHTVRGFWRLLLPAAPLLGDLITAAITILGVGGFVRFWQARRSSPDLLYAGAICLTLLITPHAMIYDWALLLIPALLLWQRVPLLRDRWRVLFCMVWIAALVSGPLAFGQMRVLPFAVQISVPVFIWVLYAAYGRLESVQAMPAAGVQDYDKLVVGSISQ